MTKLHCNWCGYDSYDFANVYGQAACISCGRVGYLVGASPVLKVSTASDSRMTEAEEQAEMKADHELMRDEFHRGRG